MLLTVANVTKTYTYDILTNASLTVAEGQKVGLIGVNGAGKSTLFKIIMGMETADSGEISLKKGAKLGYLEQTVQGLDNTVYQEISLAFSHLAAQEQTLEALLAQMDTATGDSQQALIDKHHQLSEAFAAAGGYMYQSRIRGVINGLGFDENAQLKHLSGGQKTTLAMAKLLLSDSQLLLLDEPTNHLDLKSVNWLESYLRDYPGAVMVISHDRYFINKIATKIVEIENGKTKSYSGNYDFFQTQKELQRDIALKQYENQQRTIEKTQASIDLLKSFNREKSVKRARSKEKQLDKIDRLDAPESAPHQLRLNLVIHHASGNDVLRVRDLTVGNLFTGINFDIHRQERVALIGPVGIGKSTLLKTLLAEQASDKEPHERQARFGTKVELAYYEQHQEDDLDMEATVFEEIHNAYPQMTNGEIRSLLATFTFTGDDVNKKIGMLSGGEKAKVILAKIMRSGANTLLLDEPTNHLDIFSKEILEAALIRFEGTVFFVSHDRYFVNQVATRVLELDSQGMSEYLGNYNYYVEKKAQQVALRDNQGVAAVKPHETRKPALTTTDHPPLTTTPNLSEKLTYAEQKELEKEKRKLKNQRKQTEQAITDNEATLERLNEQLADTALHTNHVALAKVYADIEATEALLLALYEQLETY